MSVPPEKPSFGQIYRQQYRQVSSSRTPRAFRIITPVVLLVAAVFLYHSPVIAIVLGALAVLSLAAVIIWSRKQQHNAANQGDMASDEHGQRK
jgi:Flp pilus assembly protein TadB